MDSLFESFHSVYFSYREFSDSITAKRHGFSNDVPEHLFGNMLSVFYRLDFVREYVGFPILITSGYRSPKLNALVGGASGSYHLSALAVDIRPKIDSEFAALKDCLSRFKSQLLIKELIFHESHGYIHVAFFPLPYTFV